VGFIDHEEIDPPLGAAGPIHQSAEFSAGCPRMSPTAIPGIEMLSPKAMECALRDSLGEFTLLVFESDIEKVAKQSAAGLGAKIPTLKAS
jgi:hypothetical protein